MALQELLAWCRQLTDDEGGYVLVDDETIVRHLNSAIREVCIRTRMLKDDSSPVARVQLVPGQARYQLNQAVQVVTAALVPGRDRPLDQVKASTLDFLYPGWSHQAQFNDVPRYAVFDVGQKEITLHRPPRDAGEMRLRLWRVPLPEEELRLAVPNGEPIIKIPDPENLKHWVAYEVYSNKDSELEDPDRARYHLGLFEGLYGPRPSLHDLELWSTSKIVRPRMQSEF